MRIEIRIFIRNIVVDIQKKKTQKSDQLRVCPFEERPLGLLFLTGIRTET